MSHYNLRSYSESARRYIDLIHSAKQQPRLECSMLLCIATRALAGHRDALQATIEAGDSDPRFEKLKRAWTMKLPTTVEPSLIARLPNAGASITPAVSRAETPEIPVPVDWRFGMDDAELNRESWPDQQPVKYSDPKRASDATWEMFLSHTRNSLSHGFVWWTSDTPPRRLPKDIHGLVLASEDRKSSDDSDDGKRYPWRSCALSVDTFRTLLLCWLKQVEASGLPWSPALIMAKLYPHKSERKTA